MAIEKVRAFFRARGMEDRIREFDVSSATVELAAQAVGCEGARIGKTLSFVHEDGAVLIVCAGDAKIDNSKFKAQFHHKATMLSPEQVLESIPPLAVPTPPWSSLSPSWRSVPAAPAGSTCARAGSPRAEPPPNTGKAPDGFTVRCFFLFIMYCDRSGGTASGCRSCGCAAPAPPSRPPGGCPAGPS